MSPTEREMHALRALAAMPFLDAPELASVSGTAARTMHCTVSALGRGGLVDAVPHATDLIAPTRRLYVTSKGLDRLAWELGVDVEDVLERYPVSAHWQRILLPDPAPTAPDVEVAPLPACSTATPAPSPVAEDE